MLLSGRTLPSFWNSHLIIVRTVGRLFHGRVLLLFPDLHTHHWVHVEADQLPGFDHSYAYLRGDVSPSEIKLSGSLTKNERD